MIQNSRDMQHSYVGGCGHCEGMAGKYRDD